MRVYLWLEALLCQEIVRVKLEDFIISLERLVASSTLRVRIADSGRTIDT